MNEKPSERDQRLLDAIFGPTGAQEPVHGGDCPACDLAAEIAGSIATYCELGRPYDPVSMTSGWNDPSTYADDVPGDTWLDLAYRLVAHHLHKTLRDRPPTSRGGNR